MHNRMIGEIVSEHYVFAYVLFYFGIEFFEHTSKTLEELCMEKDLEVEQVLSSFDSIRVSPNKKSLNLDEVYGGDHTFIVELSQINSETSNSNVELTQSSPKVSYSDTSPELGP